MKTQQLAGLFLGFETIIHNVEPNAASSAVLRYFFKKVIMSVPKERQPWRKIIHIQAGRNGRLNISNSVSYRKSDFLHSR